MWIESKFEEVRVSSMSVNDCKVFVLSCHIIRDNKGCINSKSSIQTRHQNVKTQNEPLFSNYLCKIFPVHFFGVLINSW